MAVPIIAAEPAKIIGLTIFVVVRCLRCPKGEDIALVNAQPARCPSCGHEVSLDRVEWDRRKPSPFIELSSA